MAESPFKDAQNLTQISGRPGGDPGRSPRVLYVDDNELNRALVTAILSGKQIECQTAEDGAQGVEAAKYGAWDLILMDIQMPVMDGIEAAKTIRSLPGPNASTPILALTCHTRPENLEIYAEVGFDDCIPKPVNISELLSKVCDWASGRADPQRSFEFASYDVQAV
jgi:CheY-like chemotaxis protein